MQKNNEMKSNFGVNLFRRLIFPRLTSRCLQTGLWFLYENTDYRLAREIQDNQNHFFQDMKLKKKKLEDIKLKNTVLTIKTKSVTEIAPITIAIKNIIELTTKPRRETVIRKQDRLIIPKLQNLQAQHPGNMRGATALPPVHVFRNCN